MKSVLVLLGVLLPLTCFGQSGLTGKGLFFPTPSVDSYVRLFPLKPLNLEAFTLCMRLYVDPTIVNDETRDTILFAYRTQDQDELNVWLESKNISLYLTNSLVGVTYPTPPLSIFRTNLCLTWESSTGLTALWVDGHRSTLQAYGKNIQVQSDGTVLLGQDPDSLLGDFDESQSFVGEITDVNMWDYVLTGDQIRHFNDKVWVGPEPNVINWDTVQYKGHGTAFVVPEKYK
ncbi:pentraxin fusion protein-like [Colossoma macropomum]|uniref:pentraxin fusion protein-like n=1 Tax=Colossoma macropomum TaxID=42526 RepID=UPI0018644182|nr:pentraxin fusion protein-like [Colossoma macropomum]